MQIGGTFGLSAFEQYLFWKKASPEGTQFYEHLNYPDRSNLVISDELPIKIAAVEKLVRLQKVSIEIKDHADIL